ncbi:Uncharacterised protein [Comamonas aquatica]|uniref:DNA-binding protein n=2 Tax=Comamonas aquatica TaxID=225991 RepID=A0AA35D7W1_9BURK|nr:Uncharacterised protein [Comamonas aquatica]CAB5696785.1 Uncharacterised protein [Comamonas aquatica]CAC9216221.1 Uncharacterised protein [Comamonas aquatica]CAC9685063.1 Uncharacterised protein [Comamonas aquatica]
MYKSLGMELAACAKYLHVTERTLHNWLSSKRYIPFATGNLLRLLNRMNLPGQPRHIRKRRLSSARRKP